jgi:hypothetical protein
MLAIFRCRRIGQHRLVDAAKKPAQNGVLRREAAVDAQDRQAGGICAIAASMIRAASSAAAGD